MSLPNLHIAAHDFGPIHRAEVTLRPLTLFIGPNNSGKTYLSKLVYALSTALSLERTLPTMSPKSWAADGALGAPKWQSLAGLPDQVQRVAMSLLLDTKSRCGEEVNQSLSRVFGYSYPEGLINRQAGARAATVAVEAVPERHRGLSLELTVDRGRAFTVTLRHPDLGQLQVPLPIAPYLDADEASLDAQPALKRVLWGRLLENSGFPATAPRYLPAGRSGLLTSAQAIAAAAIGAIGQRGVLTPEDAGPFSSVEGDFVRSTILGIPPDTNLLMRKEWGHFLADVLLLLETRLMQGVVLLRRSAAGLPAVVFEQDGAAYTMSQSSSMVTELAPFALWLKAFGKWGDVLFLDEPEANLHPDNQRLIARVLVRLVNAGVRVIATTHSSLILRQISNCMTASTISEQDRNALGLGQCDTIASDRVAAYVFEPGPSGSVVLPIVADPEFGFHEDEFIRVSEAIGDESSYLLDVLRRPVLA